MSKANKYKDILLEWFYYNKEDKTVRRAKDGYYGRYKKDDIVHPFTLCSHGYGGVHIPRTRTTIPYHQLVAILNGIEIEDDQVIDHIDGNSDNNDISNMRVTTQEINCRNRRIRKNNSTGITGITKASKGSGYIVRTCIKNKRIYLGYRKTLEEAVELLKTYDEARKADGYTERHGK